MKSIISAGVFFGFDSKEGWKVLAESFSGGVKFPEAINNPDETTFDALGRKAKEIKLEILECYYVHTTVQTTDIRYFYLVKRFEGSFPFAYAKIILEGKDETIIKWWSLKEFETAIFQIPDYKDGYIKAFLKMAEHNEVFRRDNAEMFERYSAMKF